MKRFFRFGLRGLLSVMAICALAMAWVGSLRRQAADEERAIHEAQMMHASVFDVDSAHVAIFKMSPYSSWLRFKCWLAGGPLERSAAAVAELRSISPSGCDVRRNGNAFGPTLEPC